MGLLGLLSLQRACVRTMQVQRRSPTRKQKDQNATASMQIIKTKAYLLGLSCPAPGEMGCHHWLRVAHLGMKVWESSMKTVVDSLRMKTLQDLQEMNEKD